MKEFLAAWSLFATEEQEEIDLENFREGCSKLGLGWKPSVAAECFNEVDTDFGGNIDFTEFSNMLSGANTPLQVEEYLGL